MLELPTGQAGGIYFETANNFQYHNAPEKTAEAQHPAHPGWRTFGDIGYVDEDGYSLPHRPQSLHRFISGGVNIYPAEIESLLITHPKVADVAVFGVPDPDFGR